MPVVKNKQRGQRGKKNDQAPTSFTTTTTIHSAMERYRKQLKNLLFDPNRSSTICWILLGVELVLNVFIVQYAKYTEIDWKAYMQEVEHFLNGTLTYSEIKGDTGPCVYPAGFLYIYTAFYYLTSHGTDVRLAQYVFIMIYLAQSYTMYQVFIRTCKLPGYALIVSAITSYRIHSVYVLRLFNDPIAVLFFWLSLSLFLKNRWRSGSAMYSLGVSVKMNILLYAPCLLLAYLTQLSLKETALNLCICAAIQLALGAPFLIASPWEYIKASFDLGRVFEHRWTVNYRFLPVPIFVDGRFHLALLVLHALLLLAFSGKFVTYFRSYRTLLDTVTDLRRQHTTTTTKKIIKQPQKRRGQKEQVPDSVVENEPMSVEQRHFLESFENQLKQRQRGGNKGVVKTTTNNKKAVVKTTTNNKKAVVKTTTDDKNEEKDDEENNVKCEINFGKIAQLFVLPFFVANLIGVCCARSLHYQFYSWYFHSLLYLAWCTSYSVPFKFLLLGLIEYCWNVYPSTYLSSALLHLAHGALLIGVYRSMKT